MSQPPEPERRLLTGWGRTAPTAAAYVSATGDDAIREALTTAPARGLIARGLGRSYGDAAQNAGGAVVDTTGHTGVDWVGDGRVRVRAGTSVEELLRESIPRGWFVPVSPGTRHVTIGGAIAADVHGKNHHADGSIARHIEAFRLVAPSFDDVVTPSSEPDLFDATHGGMGLTGIVTDATIRLTPVETSWVLTRRSRHRDLDDTMTALATADVDARYSVAWVDTLARGAALGRGIVISGDHARLEALPDRLARDPLAYDPHTRLVAPPWAPSRLLNAATVSAFNAVWYRTAPAEPSIRLERVTSFFHPLDGIRGWNRLYGSRGFVQYQCAVPETGRGVIQRALEMLADARVPSFLAVLKRFGPGTGGPLSFPMPGWTLALDVPAAAPGLARHLDAIDEDVVAAGGRVYLAKDARLRPELVRVMYPDLDRFVAVRDRVDPARILRSDLGRRLELP